MLAASGSTVGLRRTVPHILGIVVGCAALFFATGLGFGTIFREVPLVRTALRLAGAGYLLYLAWRLWTTSSLASGDLQRPIRFAEAAVFQLVNAKAWMAIIPAVAVFSDPVADPLTETALIYCLYQTVMIPSLLLWTAAGATARRFLERPSHLLLFNRTMAGLTAATALLFLV